MLTKAWKRITINLIIKLLKLKKLIIKAKYDSILIITNRLTKYYYFIKYKKAFNEKKLIYIFK